MSKTLLFLFVFTGAVLNVNSPALSKNIQLSQPSLKGNVSVEEALQARRTHRSYGPGPIDGDALSQMLWAAYGVTAKHGGLGLKTAPSAGALYPLDVYAVVGDKTAGTLTAGIYHYIPAEHAIFRVKDGDLRAELGRAALGQMWLSDAPVVLVITGEFARTEVKYGPRGQSYVLMESGCVAQNIFLQAEAIGLKAGIIGAFENDRVNKLLGLPEAHLPLLIMPVGFRK